MTKGSVLVADDDAAIRVVLNRALTRAGYHVRITSNVSNLWQWISNGEGDCVVSDVIMPDGNAFELLPRIKDSRPDLPVILISAQNTFMTALKAQEAQAYEYLPKPFDLEKLISAVNQAINEPKDNKLAQNVKAYGEEMPLVGRSPDMQEVFRVIAHLRNSDFPVMLSGESGTGKHLIAKVLHEFGVRKHKPFVTVNLATLLTHTIEFEIFGGENADGKFVAGALHRANGGTLYLNEISLLPKVVQARLLRVLVEKQIVHPSKGEVEPVDIRLISSTIKELAELSNQKDFSRDLFYRMNVVPIHVPPLRKRTQDIPDLARHFLRVSGSHQAQAKYLDPEAITILKDHAWPGNVRELENLIRRVCILHPQDTITEEMVDSEIRDDGYQQHIQNDGIPLEFVSLQNAIEFFVERYFDQGNDISTTDGLYQKFLTEFEYPLITAALSATNGNQIKAAKILGLNRNTLRKKIQNLGIRIVKTAE
ncbi:MAG: sigma 54-interacting transcriptional regulator [Rhizobiaceae bacterium]